MARAYSQDLRERVIAATEAGLPARHAADRFGVGIATAIVWARRAREPSKASGERSEQSSKPSRHTNAKTTSWPLDTSRNNVKML